MASLNKTVLAFITVGITGSCIIAPVDAHAQSIGDFLGSVGLGLGAGGNCDTGESSETGESRNKDGSTKTPYKTTIGKTDCSDGAAADINSWLNFESTLALDRQKGAPQNPWKNRTPGWR